jgi:DeoR/GlpR family transcriptional regulator of sugar metabolism
VETERAMIGQSEKVVMLADSSKFGKKSMVRMCDIDEIDTLITDYKEENRELILQIREKEVEVVEVAAWTKEFA